MVRKRKSQKIIVLSIFMLLAFITYQYLNTIAYPLVRNIAEAKVKAIATNALNQASASLRALEAFYGEFYEYVKNDKGDIILISGNTLLINQINVVAQKEVQDSLNTLSSKTVDIPLGAFSGSTILAGFGPPVNISLVPIGSTSCEFKSSFKSAGINQTVHRFYIVVNTVIELVVPLKEITVELTSEIFIAENIIIGKVPDVYLNGNIGGGILDLIP